MRVRDLLSTITCRWEITVMIMVQALALYVFGQWAGDARLDTADIVLVLLFGLFAQGLCSVLNDITDVLADLVNHPGRPLPSGRVTVAQAWVVVVGCLAGTLATGAALAGSVLSGLLLAGRVLTSLACSPHSRAHLTRVLTSLAYSLPGVRLGRHWLRGPLAPAASTVCGILFVLSCTALPSSPGGGRVLLLVAVVCLVQYLLVIPLKDVMDVRGDASAGGTSLAMRLPGRLLRGLARRGLIPAALRRSLRRRPVHRPGGRAGGSSFSSCHCVPSATS